MDNELASQVVPALAGYQYKDGVGNDVDPLKYALTVWTNNYMPNLALDAIAAFIAINLAEMHTEDITRCVMVPVDQLPKVTLITYPVGYINTDKLFTREFWDVTLKSELMAQAVMHALTDRHGNFRTMAAGSMRVRLVADLGQLRMDIMLIGG